MTDYTAGAKPGVEGSAKCTAIKHSFNNGDRGNGVDGYQDTHNIPWTYVTTSGNGTLTDPYLYISYSNNTLEYAVEIPLLEIKIIIPFDATELPAGYSTAVSIVGTVITFQSTKSGSPTITSTLDTKDLFEDVATIIFTVSPNPFTSEINATISQEFYGANTNLAFVIRNFSGNVISTQNVTGTTTTFVTTEISSGNYLIFLEQNGDILEYRYIIK